MRADRTAVALAVTMGDPRSIGPEVIVKALARDDLPADARLLVVGSHAVLAAAAERMGMPLALPRTGRASGQKAWPALLDLDNFPVDGIEPRRPDALSGRASVDYIERAVASALAGEVDGVVTAPISKEAIAAAGSPFPGHTEMIAHLTGAPTPVMMLVNGRLRVALVTTHVALRDVPRLLRAESIVDIARVLAPAVVEAHKAGIDLVGPEPGDSVFLKAVGGAYDAVLALYHDQGMIPVKMGGLGAVVNVTLGLPIVRTSVGHGTAYDIAGTGRADEGSLVEALRLGAQMARAARRSAPGQRGHGKP